MSKKTWIIATLGLLFGLISGGGIVFGFSSKKTEKLVKVTQFQSSSSLFGSSSSVTVSSGGKSSSSIVESSKSQTESKNLETNLVTQSLFGWIENDSISADLIFDKSQIYGKLKNISKGKKYDIIGVFNSEGSKLVSNKLEFQIFENGLFSGKFSFHNQKLKKIQNQSEYDQVTQNYETENYTPILNHHPLKQVDFVSP